MNKAYIFVGVPQTASLYLRRVDGSNTATAYISVQDAQGRYYNFTTPSWEILSEATAANWANHVNQLASEQDGNTVQLSTYKSIHDFVSGGALTAGFYRVLVYESASYDTAVVSEHLLYFDPANGWKVEPHLLLGVKTDTAAILADTADIQPKIGTPANGTLAADIAAIQVGTTQPRINDPATIRLVLSDRKSGKHEATEPARVRPGTLNITVSVDCQPWFGEGVRVKTVGPPAVSAGAIVATQLGPRDFDAVISLSGTAVAGEQVTVTFEVEVVNGDSTPVTVNIQVLDT